jgi:hypothetical protein
LESPSPRRRVDSSIRSEGSHLNARIAKSQDPVGQFDVGRFDSNNLDLVKNRPVRLVKGNPSLAVLSSSNRLPDISSAEFERALVMTGEDVPGFLNSWKVPANAQE